MVLSPRSLVPIRVGMILIAIEEGTVVTACPHTRGDDPRRRIDCNVFCNLSPYAWG